MSQAKHPCKEQTTPGHEGRHYPVVSKRVLVAGEDAIVELVIEAPLIAIHAEAGQFVIVHAHEMAERIPLTIADYDREAGTITLIIQRVGLGTSRICAMEKGQTLLDVLGPLGVPVEIKKYDKAVVCIGGGVGIAPVYPKVKELYRLGNRVISIIGARTKRLLFYEEEMRAASSGLHVTTDDGSYGRHGFVTVVLHEIIERQRNDIAEIIAVGPLPMMEAVVKEVAGKSFRDTYDPATDYIEGAFIPTIVSLNPIMVDGTGMCGGCRVNIWNPQRGRYDVKFSCVDGPAFDGHLVDFNVLTRRNQQYLKQEKLVFDMKEENAQDAAVGRQALDTKG